MIQSQREKPRGNRKRSEQSTEEKPCRTSGAVDFMVCHELQTSMELFSIPTSLWLLPIVYSQLCFFHLFSTLFSSWPRCCRCSFLFLLLFFPFAALDKSSWSNPLATVFLFLLFSIIFLLLLAELVGPFCYCSVPPSSSAVRVRQ